MISPGGACAGPQPLRPPARFAGPRSCVPSQHSEVGAPPAGRGGARAQHTPFPLPHRRPCWSTQQGAQPNPRLSALESPAVPPFPRTGMGAHTSGCRPPASPGCPSRDLLADWGSRAGSPTQPRGVGARRRGCSPATPSSTAELLRGFEISPAPLLCRPTVQVGKLRPSV